jgi:uncharacterized protein (TIGR00255 family)
MDRPDTDLRSRGRVRSMTGHGVGSAPLRTGRVEVDIRAVNHRYLEVRSRLPPELAEHTALVEDVARRVLVRGRLEIAVRTEGEAFDEPILDATRARAAFEQLVALRDALSPRDPVPLGLLASVPELFVPRGSPDAALVREALTRATEQACDGVIAMRQREGDTLTLDFESRLTRVLELTMAIEQRSPVVVAAVRRRLEERIEKLLSPPSPIDDRRLELEVVIFADRSDVTEECTRLRSHVEQFRVMLLDDDTVTGRRLDFLLQEMARESNTIGSKSADAELARTVVDLKTEIERLREQVQNIL